MYLFITYFVSLNMLWYIVAIFTSSKKGVELIVNLKKKTLHIFFYFVSAVKCAL